MALQIAALNDEPFIFVILRTLQRSRYGTLVVLRESAAPITLCPGPIVVASDYIPSKSRREVVTFSPSRF